MCSLFSVTLNAAYDFTVTAVASDYDIYVSWNVYSGASYYNVALYKDDAWLSTTKNVTTTSLSFTELEDGTYYVYVAPYNSSGKSLSSSVASNTVTIPNFVSEGSADTVTVTYTVDDLKKTTNQLNLKVSPKLHKQYQTNLNQL